jgi:hypothetical protein
MRALSLIKSVFTLIGVGMLAGVAILYVQTRSFIAEAVEVKGTVVRASDRPVVTFMDQRGVPVELTASTSTSPPRYALGETVTVLYRPDDLSSARIKSFFDLWFGTVFLAGFGALFTAVGAGFFIASRVRARKEEVLRASGIPIETDIQTVQLNTRLEVNGEHPFQVLTQWLNPATSEVHVFKSHNVWFDPTQYLDGRRVTVYIEPNNPKKYFVDLSFLPNGQ